MANTEPITGTYQTLSGQPGSFVVENPPFHPNILNIPLRQVGVTNTGGTDTVQGTSNAQLYRGLMASRVQTGQSQQFRVNFLYNPATISESRSLDLNNGVLPSYARNPDDPTKYATGLNAMVNFSLLFDRTFELWDSAYVNTDAGRYGISVDTNAFYNMLNINQLNTQAPVALGGSVPVDTTATYSYVVQGTMSAVPVDLYFGFRSMGALKYFGYVSDLEITYTHFNQKMVPQRCALQVGFTLMSDLFSSSATQ